MDIQVLRTAYLAQAIKGIRVDPVEAVCQSSPAAVLAEIDLGVGQNNTPMTFMHEGKQYVVVSVGSTDHPAELVALALP